MFFITFLSLSLFAIIYMYFMKVRNADILLFPQKENLNLDWNVSSEIYSYMEIVHGVVSQHSWGLQI